MNKHLVVPVDPVLTTWLMNTVNEYCGYETRYASHVAAFLYVDAIN